MKKKSYLIENIEEIRRRINKEFIIQLYYPKEKRKQAVGLSGLCKAVGNLHAEHWCKKALRSKKIKPCFNGFSGSIRVTFYPR